MAVECRKPHDEYYGPKIFTFNEMDILKYPVLWRRVVPTRLHDPLPDNKYSTQTWIMASLGGVGLVPCLKHIKIVRAGYTD